MLPSTNRLFFSLLTQQNSPALLQLTSLALNFGGAHTITKEVLFRGKLADVSRRPRNHRMGIRSSLFGRSLAASVLTRTPPLHNVGVQMSTPHFTDRYPYVRYSYGNTDTSLGIATQSES
ncbi:hypothetical protein OSTOST_11019, partial [Ostertagia ostertagi]